MMHVHLVWEIQTRFLMIHIQQLLLNPATLALARKFTINTSVGANLYNNEAFFISDSLLSQRTETVLYQLGIVIPLVSDTADNNFAISLGYNRSKDFNRILKFNGFNSTNSSLIQDLTSINNYIPRDLLLSYPEFDPGSNEYLGDRTIFNGNLEPGRLCSGRRWNKSLVIWNCR